MKPFVDEFEKDHPSLRIGTRVPPEGVNVAFGAAPKFSAADVEVVDYSTRIPENTATLHEIEGDLFVDENGLLRDEEGRSILPTEDILITNLYYDDEGVSVPLFYVARSRFYHYEPDPIIEDGYYRGDRIRIESDRGEVGPYRIALLATEDPNIWRIEAYTSFQNEAGSSVYRLAYHKSDRSGSAASRNPDHREVLNAEPLFIPKTEDTYDPDEPNTYKVTVDREGIGYHVHVPDSSTLVERSPLWMRWRVVRSGNKSSPWFSETLYHADSLHPEELVQDGRTVYTMEEGVAYKHLHDNLDDLFGASTFKIILDDQHPYSVEYEVWNGSAWVPDTQGWVTARIVPIVLFKGSLYYFFGSLTLQAITGYRLEAAITGSLSTGAADTSDAMRTLEASESLFSLLVEAFEDKEAVGEQTIWHDVSRDGTVTSNLNTSQFPERSDVSKAIDGIIHYDTRTHDYNHDFYAYSKEATSPPMTSTDIVLTLDQPTVLESIFVDMGNRGEIERLQIENSQGTTTLWQGGQVVDPSLVSVRQTHFSDPYFVRYAYDLAQPTTVHKIHVRIKPTKWYVRTTHNYVWLFFHISWNYQDWYRSGFSLHNISAWYKEVIPAFVPWSAKNTLYGTTGRNSPYRVPLSGLVDQLRLAPPPSADLSSVRYRIRLVSGDPESTLKVRHLSGSNRLVFQDDGSYVVDHQDLDKVFVEVTTDAYHIRSSPRYSVTTVHPGNLTVYKPDDVGDDAWWALKVNNGRLVIRDFAKGLFKVYFITEFGTQAFDPGIPFRRSEDEVPQFLDRRRLKVAHFPLHVTVDDQGHPTNLKVYRHQGETRQELAVADWVASTGEIWLAERIEFTDILTVDYTYRMQHLEYTGFTPDGQTFYHLDLNPLPGHTYTDLETGQEVPSAQLLEKDIYLYCMPYFVQTLAVHEPSPPVEPFEFVTRGLSGGAIRHLIVDEGTPEPDVLEKIREADEEAILLAKVLVRRTALPENLHLLDTRRRGGGLIDDLSLDAAKRLSEHAEDFWDLGTWDGDPYPASGVSVITLPASVLERVSEEAIRDFLDRHVAFGTYPIVRFVHDEEA